MNNLSNEKKTKILVIDDDFSFSFLVAESLLNQGYIVEEIDNGIECLKRIEDIAPDMIILDVLMPDQDGYETCEKIRKLANFEHTPILMMTGLEDELSIQTAYLAGATDFIAKPFNFSLFLQRVQFILRNSDLTTALIKSERRLAEAKKLAKLAYWEWDAQSKVVHWSKSISDTLRLALKLDKKLDNDLEHTFNFLLERVPVQDKRLVQNWINEAIAGYQPAAITHRILIDHDQTIYVRQMVASNFDRDGHLSFLIGSILDVTEMHQAQEEIKKLAYYDSLTKLPNRAFLREILEQTVKLAAREQRTVGLLFIDLDNFKRINDTLGHESGDLLLKAVTQRMKNCLRESDVISYGNINSLDHSTNQLARLGSDEFTLLLPEIASPEGAAVVAKRLINALSAPFNLAGNDIVTTTSIGISVFPNDAKTAEEFLKNSGVAMYYAKKIGKNNYRFFNEEMNLETINRMKLDAAMQTAIANNEFQLVYQPQIEVSTGELSGVEALIRWHSPTLGFITPDKFISLAEENGMIIQIGEWVIREACRQAKLWISQGVKLKRVAVNVSARQFQQTNFDEMIRLTLTEANLPPEVLDLELTEGILMINGQAALDMLNKLKVIGVGLSIDDFGTGYSSLSYLSKFPIDHLKIDKSFIDNVTTNKNDSAIVKAVIAMAGSMGMRVTCEGVENEDQYAYLKTQGCTEIQGYFFSKPLPAEELPKFTARIPRKLDMNANSDLRMGIGV